MNDRAFSTSGSFLLIFTGLFIAVGSLYTVTANTAERVTDATGTQTDQLHEIQETQVNATAAVWNTTTENLTVRVTNTGETTLEVSAVDVLVDGSYVPREAFERAEVDGEATDIWLPGGQLVLEDSDSVDGSTPPQRVKIVTGPGVAAVLDVEVTS